MGSCSHSLKYLTAYTQVSISPSPALLPFNPPPPFLPFLPCFPLPRLQPHLTSQVHFHPQSMCLKAENQWLKSCSPCSGRIAPRGIFPVKGLERSGPATQPCTHTPPAMGARIGGRTTYILAHTSVGTGIHLCRCVCLSVFLSLPVWFSPLPCPLLLRFWPSAATGNKSLQLLELSSSFT